MTMTGLAAHWQVSADLDDNGVSDLAVGAPVMVMVALTVAQPGFCL